MQQHKLIAIAYSSMHRALKQFSLLYNNDIWTTEKVPDEWHIIGNVDTHEIRCNLQCFRPINQRRHRIFIEMSRKPQKQKIWQQFGARHYNGLERKQRTTL